MLLFQQLYWSLVIAAAWHVVGNNWQSRKQLKVSFNLLLILRKFQQYYIRIYRTVEPYLSVQGSPPWRHTCYNVVEQSLWHASTGHIHDEKLNITHSRVIITTYGEIKKRLLYNIINSRIPMSIVTPTNTNDEGQWLPPWSLYCFCSKTK